MSRKKRSTQPEKPAGTPDDPVDALAKQIHDKSEQDQYRIYNKKKGDNNYVIIPWEQITEGYYKEHVRKLARKKLEDGEVQSKIHR